MAHNPSRRAFLGTAAIVGGATGAAILGVPGVALADGDGNAAVVNAMFANWETGNAASAASYFAEDAVFTNIPAPPSVVGKANIQALFETVFSLVDDISITITRQVAHGNYVMNERLDHWRYLSDNAIIDLPVAGAFTVVNNKITVWSDYFDLAQSQFATHL